MMRMIQRIDTEEPPSSFVVGEQTAEAAERLRATLNARLTPRNRG